MHKPTLVLAAALVAVGLVPVTRAEDSSAPATSQAAPEAAAQSHVEGAAPAAAAAPAEAAKAQVAEGAAKPEGVQADSIPPDPVICKSTVETGSLGRRTKVCMTKSEWDAHRNAAKRYKQSIDRSRSTQPGGGG